jgi:hypothetical protein
MFKDHHDDTAVQGIALDHRAATGAANVGLDGVLDGMFNVFDGQAVFGDVFIVFTIPKQVEPDHRVAPMKCVAPW